MTFLFLWFFIFKPNRQRHSKDKEYFGEYELYKIKGDLNQHLYKNKKLKIVLKSDFTYNLTSFNETEFQDETNW